VDDINIKKYEPLFGSWTIDRVLGEGSFGKVYALKKTDFGKEYYSALKVITIPQSKSEISSLRSEGMSEMSIKTHYDQFVKDVVSEFELMARFRGNSNIVSYEDHMMIPHEDGFGYDILIRMELLTSLVSVLERNNFKRSDVIQLGIDMCKALELCQKDNIIHRDIKPDNIFVSEHGNYKLGDFGVARTAEKTGGEMSKKGTYTYMAPEVYKGESYNISVDLYSLGIVLYRLMNGNRTPLLPPPPAQVTHSDRENALARRMSGEKIPPPKDADIRLANIIMKSIEYNPRDRYANAKQMREDLEASLNSSDFSSFEEERTVYVTDAVTSFDRTATPAGKSGELPSGKNKGKNKYIKIAAIAAGAVLAIVLGIALLKAVGVFGKTTVDDDDITTNATTIEVLVIDSGTTAGEAVTTIENNATTPENPPTQPSEPTQPPVQDTTQPPIQETTQATQPPTQPTQPPQPTGGQGGDKEDQPTQPPPPDATTAAHPPATAESTDILDNALSTKLNSDINNNNFVSMMTGSSYYPQNGLEIQVTGCEYMQADDGNTYFYVWLYVKNTRSNPISFDETDFICAPVYGDDIGLFYSSEYVFDFTTNSSGTAFSYPLVFQSNVYANLVLVYSTFGASEMLFAHPNILTNEYGQTDYTGLSYFYLY